MPEDRPTISSARLSSVDVARHTFGTVRRGFDPQEVRSFLEHISRELALWEQRASDLRHELSDAENRARHPVLDEAALTSGLGQHSAQVIRKAHDEGARISAEAEEQAAAILREAHQHAADMRVRAEATGAERIAEADLSASASRQEAERESNAIRDAARAEAENLLTQTRDSGRAIIEEAQQARKRVLNDLAQRRHALQVHIEQIRAARDELARSVITAREHADRIAADLLSGDDGAREAAAEVMRRSSTVPEGVPAVEDVEEVEIHLKADTSLPNSAGRVPTGTEKPTVDEQPGVDEQERTTASTKSAPAKTDAQVRANKPEGVASPTAASTSGGTEASPDAEQDADKLRIAAQRAHDVASQAGKSRVSKRAAAAGASRAADESSEAGEPTKPVIKVSTPGQELVVDAGKEGSRAPGEQGGRDSGAGGGEEAKGTVSAEGSDDQRGSSHHALDDLFARIRASHETPAPTEQVAAVSTDASPRPAASGAASSVSTDQGSTSARAPSGSAARSAGASSKAAAVAEKPKRSSRAKSSRHKGTHQDHASDTTGSATLDDDALVRRAESMIEDVEGRLTRRLKRSLQDDQNHLLEQLRQRSGTWGDDVVPDEAAHSAFFADATVELLRDAAAAGAQFAGAKAKDGQGVVGETAVRALADELGLALVTDLGRHLPSGKVEDASDIVSAAYRDWRGERAQRLAGDHAVRAFCTGVTSVAGSKGHVRWLVGRKTPACADCEDNSLSGALAVGEAFPTGHQLPPAHAGCRCVVVVTS